MGLKEIDFQTVSLKINLLMKAYLPGKLYNLQKELWQVQKSYFL